MLTQDQLKEFIVDELLEDDDVEVANDTSLFKERLLDSLNLLALISFIEDQAGIKVESSEITLENVDTIDLVIEFVSRKSA